MKRKKTRSGARPKVRKRNGAKIESYDIVVGNVSIGSVVKKVGELPWQATSAIARRGSVVRVQETFPSKEAAVSSVIERHKTDPRRRHNEPLTAKLGQRADLQAIKRRVMR